MASREESSEQNYSKLRTRTLQKRLGTAESQLSALRQRFPSYRSWVFGKAYGDTPPEWFREMERLSRELGKIATELSKRGKLRASGDSSTPQDQPADRMDNASSKRANVLAPSKKADPEVAKRRTLARTNDPMPVGELCELFDREKVPMPSKWQEAGLRFWKVAYENAEYKSRIDVIVSKDRRSVRA